MSKSIPKFRTYAQQSRREFDRHNRDRKVEVRYTRMQVIYSKTAATEIAADVTD